MLILLLVLLPCVLANDISKYCYSRHPFSGYKFQLEISPNKSNYTLIYCRDNKFIYRSTVKSLSEPFRIGGNNLTITKFSSNFLPNKLSGNLLLNGEFLCPLLSDNLMNSWLEINTRSLHIPLLTSPPINSKYYPV
ncbi:hypothetical protein CLIB1444_08S02322 [[Candida] jaroonii]|uniref:Uncharacterized protein n=1 Tax=[Candida] jaroonii TaxID=467808 RepID=A0ACA9YAQ1_9ASCO|nr:hypothetical protein CLIB1444_08S02322 [[Candida] jaroonii]